jgi:hypothetical protein
MTNTRTIVSVCCQICGQRDLQHLIQAPKSVNGRRRLVICQNEYVTHYRVGGTDYLVRTAPVDEINAELVLN